MTVKVTQLSIDYVQNHAAISIVGQGSPIANVTVIVGIETPGNRREDMNERAAIDAGKALLHKALNALETYDPTKT